MISQAPAANLTANHRPEHEESNSEEAVEDPE